MIVNRKIAIGAAAIVGIGILAAVSMPQKPPEVIILPEHKHIGQDCGPCEPSYFQACREGSHLIGSIPAPMGNYRVVAIKSYEEEKPNGKDMCLIRKVVEITQMPPAAGATNSIEIHEWDNVDFEYFCGFDLKVVKPFPGEPERIFCDLRK